MSFLTVSQNLVYVVEIDVKLDIFTSGHLLSVFPGHNTQ